MKTTLGNLPRDHRLTQSNRRLFRDLGLLMLAVVVLATATVVYFDQRQVEALSRKLISSTAETVAARLVSFFATEDSNLRIAAEQLQIGWGGKSAGWGGLFAQLAPFLNQHQNASGILLAAVDGDGEYYGILKPRNVGSELLVRTNTGQEVGPGRAKLERWQAGELLEHWYRQDDFDPRSRIWYQKTLETEENTIAASGPYLFHTSNKHGITISTHWRQAGTGRRFILAIDIVLVNISRFTQTLRPTPNGIVFVFSQDLRLVGLPADERFGDEGVADAVLFQPISTIELPLLQAGMSAWENQGRTRHSFPFAMAGQTWWAGFTWIEDHPHQTGFWTGILVPESDFLGKLPLQRNFVLAVVAGVGFLVGLIILFNALRKLRHEVRQAVSHGGQRLGPFELLYQIGQGGNGTVYRANHALLKRPTAVKVMLPGFASSASAKKRFIEEVQITSRLTHPNTVAVFDFGETAEGTLYFAMEYLNGVNLDKLVHICGPQPAARVLHILHHACGALGEAHRNGLIHRDIKPANIMLCERGGVYDVVKVLDYGLVQEASQTAPHVDEIEGIIGTPLYLAPELISGESAVSPQSDLYALGGLAYYLLTGRNVFEGGTAMEVCAMHLHDEPVPPSQITARSIPADLEAIVMACLLKDPVERPPTAEELAILVAACRDYGSWHQNQARDWWSENQEVLPMEAYEASHPPLSNTQRLVF